MVNTGKDGEETSNWQAGGGEFNRGMKTVTVERGWHPEGEFPIVLCHSDPPRSKAPHPSLCYLGT